MTSMDRRMVRTAKGTDVRMCFDLGECRVAQDTPKRLWISLCR